jgi:hypothetical protein
MFVVVELTSGSVSLAERDDLQRFAVRVLLPAAPEDRGDQGVLGAIAAALSVHDAGTVDPDGNVFIPVAVVRRLAEQAAVAEGEVLGDDWESRLSTMVEQASAHGWLSEDGAIRAHIEWDQP